MSETKPDIIIPRQFARLLDTDWREAAIHGGRGSLKSGTVARILLMRASTKRGRCGCFREFQNSIDDSVHSLFRGIIEEHQLPNFKITDKKIINTVTGYDFVFKGLHGVTVQSIKSIEGMTEAWVEEAQTITENSLDVLTPTVRLDGSQIFYTFNRLKTDDPVYKRLVIEGRPGSIEVNVNYDTALAHGMLSDVLYNEMLDDKNRRPEIYKHKWLGEPANLKGQIYKNFKKIEAIPKDAVYLGPGLDFGYTNDPTALIDVWKWNNAYILDEQLYNKGMLNKQIGEQILKLPHYSHQIAVGDSSEPKSIQEIKEMGVTIIGATKGKDSVNNGIQLLQGLEIYYTAQSHNIEEEVLNYQWRVDKEDKSLNVPIDAYNHALDAARYKITDAENFKPIVWPGIR